MQYVEEDNMLFFYIIIGMIVSVLFLGVSAAYDLLYYTWMFILIAFIIYYLDFLILRLYENNDIDRKSLKIPLIFTCDGIILFITMRYAYKYAVNGIINWGGFLYKNHYILFCVISIISIILLLIGVIWLFKNIFYNIYRFIKDMQNHDKTNLKCRLLNIIPYAVILVCFLVVCTINYAFVTSSEKKIHIAQEQSVGKTYDDIKGMSGGFGINVPYTRYVVKIIDNNTLSYSQGTYRYINDSGWQADNIEETAEYKYSYEVKFGGRIFIVFNDNRYRVHLTDSNEIESISLEHPERVLKE